MEREALKITLDEAKEQGLPLFGFCNICKKHKPNDWNITSIDICDECYEKGFCTKCGGKREVNSTDWRCKKCKTKWNKMLNNDIKPFFKKIGVM